MIIFIFFLFVAISQKSNSYSFSNFIYSLVGGVSVLFAATEILSLFRCVTLGGILSFWMIADVIVLVFAIIAFKKHRVKTRISVVRTDLLFIVIVVLAAISLFIAFTMVPINYDSMTYHLSRVAHWANNQSVAYYATHTLRQLTSPMLSEYIMLHYYVILGKNDVLVNMVQSGSYIVCALVIMDIAKKLGANPFFQYFSALIFMMTPIVLAESVTTQNDVFASVWLLILVDILIDYLQGERLELNFKTVADIVVLAICVAFGYLSKPNVCIAMLFFVIWLLLECLKRKDSLINVLLGIGIASITMLIILAPFFCRNYMMMGHFTAEITGAKQLVGTRAPRYLFINFIKNFTFNFPNIVDKDCQERIYNLLVNLSDLLHVNLDDPTISEEGHAFMVHGADVKSMDTAVNPVMIFLFTVIILPMIVIDICKKKRDLNFKYAVASAISFLTFLAVLRWEPYISRYMIGYFAILLPVIVVGIQELLGHMHRIVGYILIFLIMLGCISDYYLTILDIRGNYNIYDTKEECYFTLNHDQYEIYKDVADYVKEHNCKKIGLLSAENYYDYPLYKMVEDTVDEYKHVAVKNGDYIFNDSYKYEDSTYNPDVIFAIANRVDENSYYEYNGKKYQVVRLYESEGWISLLTMVD